MTIKWFSTLPGSLKLDNPHQMPFIIIKKITILAVLFIHRVILSHGDREVLSFFSFFFFVFGDIWQFPMKTLFQYTIVDYYASAVHLLILFYLFHSFDVALWLSHWTATSILCLTWRLKSALACAFTISFLMANNYLISVNIQIHNNFQLAKSFIFSCSNKVLFRCIRYLYF